MLLYYFQGEAIERYLRICPFCKEEISWLKEGSKILPREIPFCTKEALRLSEWNILDSEKDMVMDFVGYVDEML